MRKGKIITGVLLSCVLMLSLAACGSADASGNKNGTGLVSNQKTVNDVLAEQTDDGSSEGTKADAVDSTNADSTDAANQAADDASTNDKAGETDSGSEDTAGKKDGGVDVDLTTMSATMVYSEVSNIVTNPDAYMGKTLRMEGNTAVYHDETDGNDYYACVIKDATACCAQGIEFQLKDKNYPEADTEVTVVGTFSSYKIGDYDYYTLVDAVME